MVNLLEITDIFKNCKHVIIEFWGEDVSTFTTATTTTTTTTITNSEKLELCKNDNK